MRPERRRAELCPRRVTTMMGVPTHYRMMAQQRRFATTDLSSLRLLVVGGAQMPLPLLRQALQAWPETEFIQAYGLTEVCGVVSRLMPEDHRATV